MLHYESKKIPNVTNKQNNLQISKLKNFLNNFLRLKNQSTILMNDECYFNLEDIKLSDKYFYQQNRIILINKNKFTVKSKFPEKIML